MFTYEGLPPPCCPLCVMAQKERFVRVRALVKELPGITAMEAHQQTGVPISEIMELLEEGDLVVAGSLSNRQQHDLEKFRMNYDKVGMDSFKIGRKR